MVDLILGSDPDLVPVSLDWLAAWPDEFSLWSSVCPGFVLDSAWPQREAPSSADSMWHWWTYQVVHAIHVAGDFCCNGNRLDDCCCCCILDCNCRMGGQLVPDDRSHAVDCQPMGSTNSRRRCCRVAADSYVHSQIGHLCRRKWKNMVRFG